MSRCRFDGCTLESIENDEKCILHCVKGEYQEDSRRLNFLESFTDKLIDYILERIFEYRNEEEFPTREQLKAFLNGTDRERYRQADIITFLQNKEVAISRISFPERDNRDLFDYKKVLEKIGGIHFDLCEFYASTLSLRNVKLFFQQCIFHKKWYLHNYEILENVREVLYENCNFREDISTAFEINEKHELDTPVFSDCTFAKSIILEEVNIQNKLFNDTGDKNLTLKKFNISRCTFNDKFIVNDYKVDEFICTDSFFNEKVEFKKNNVLQFYINNTNFSKLVDCYSTSFQKFEIRKSIFEDFVNFENCEFGLVDKSDDEEFKALFLHATMMSFINFRHAKFYSGLDLAHINLKEPPNFFDATVPTHNTNRETFRIIKHSFDKVGNYIEANKFYEKEMLKFKEEVKSNKNNAAYFLLRIYELTSNYGQSYLRPIGWMILLSVAYWLCIIGYENNLLYSSNESLNSVIESVSKIINGIAKHIMPVSRVLKEGMEFISLLFYITFTILIWLTILAIKRSTKR